LIFSTIFLVNHSGFLASFLCVRKIFYGNGLKKEIEDAKSKDTEREREKEKKEGRG